MSTSTEDVHHQLVQIIWTAPFKTVLFSESPTFIPVFFFFFNLVPQCLNTKDTAALLDLIRVTVVQDTMIQDISETLLSVCCSQHLKTLSLFLLHLYKQD